MCIVNTWKDKDELPCRRPSITATAESLVQWERVFRGAASGYYLVYRELKQDMQNRDLALEEKSCQQHLGRVKERFCRLYAEVHQVTEVEARNICNAIENEEKAAADAIP